MSRLQPSEAAEIWESFPGNFLHPFYPQRSAGEPKRTTPPFFPRIKQLCLVEVESEEKPFLKAVFIRISVLQQAGATAVFIFNSVVWQRVKGS